MSGWLALALSLPTWAVGDSPVSLGHFLLAFLGGLALNLTPCVYPLIPITISFFADQARQRLAHSFLLAVSYVIGLAITYSALGLLASLTGGMLGWALQRWWVPVPIALIMVALGLSLCGLFEFRVPFWLSQRLGTARWGAFGALGMGMTAGVIAAPCIGPFVLGLLLYVGQLGKPVVGFWLFFALAVGLGLPYLLLGFFAGSLHRLPKSGAWLVWVKKILGCLVFGVALNLVFPLLSPALGRGLLFALLLGCGLYLGWGSGLAMRGGWRWVQRVSGFLLLLSAALVWFVRIEVSSPIAWVPYTESILQESAGKPLLIDVYADWCIPCREMDATTYKDPRVVEGASRFVMVKMDVTDQASPAVEAFLGRHRVLGVPTLLVFDADGRERSELRRVGFVGAEELLTIMDRLEGS